MKTRHVVMMGIAVLMVGALMTGAVQALEVQPKPVAVRSVLENVRDYAPAASVDAPTYAVDAGILFSGGPGSWTEVRTPHNIIVGAVAVDRQRPNVVYIGAANEMTLFRSPDGGENWLRVPLSDVAGGVTDIAVDGAQRLVYIGTDTAGVFRVRDVGSSMIVGGQLLLSEPVRQVATDSTGAAMAFARTDTALYRAENYGLAWSNVEDLHSSPTALAIANSDPATVYVGTMDRGILTSTDGRTWSMANEGLGAAPGTRMHVDALALDPVRPSHIYVAASYLLGSTTLHQTPSHIATSVDGATTWSILEHENTTTVVELLPVSGTSGAVYALTAESRTPTALYDEARVAGNLIDSAELASVTNPGFSPSAAVDPIPLALLVGALAALALGVFVTVDMHQRGVRPLAQGITLTSLDTQTVTSVG